MELTGRVALVTGAASGMGRATASRLVDEGMKVCALDIDGDAIREVAEPIGALPVACDVSDPDQVDAAFAQCVEHFGSLDLAHLNAGVGLRWSGDIAELDVADYRRSVGVNLDGVVFGTRAAVRAMRARPEPAGEGVIVATASIAGILPFHPDAIYTIGKHGVVGLIRAIAPNLAPEGIAVHAICPGTTETGMLSDSTKEFFRKADIAMQPPEDIAAAVVLAATSPIEATGSCWIADPGEEPYPFEFNDVPGPSALLNVPVPRAPKEAAT
jgi:NAD(P)-dependent dehydrogenase (short-subunit alcohol dehydrogenase family)